MFFADPALDNSAHQTPPTQAPFNAVQHFAGRWAAAVGGMGGAVIGPDVVATSGHIFGSDAIEGFEFTAMGVTRQVVSVHRSVTQDALYLKMNGTYPDSPVIWNNEHMVDGDNWMFMWGVGQGRGEPLMIDGKLAGWNHGDDSTSARRWGAARFMEVSTRTTQNYITAEFQLDLVNDPYCFEAAPGDSGSCIFVDAGVGRSWLFVGVVGTSGSNYFSTPDHRAYGVSSGTTLKELPLLLSLGCRIQPSSITINKPTEGIIFTEPQLIIEGLTVGNPSQITVELQY